jgi:hypothetical protein
MAWPDLARLGIGEARCRVVLVVLVVRRIV